MLNIILNATKQIRMHISAVTGQRILHDFDQTLYDKGQIDVEYLKWYSKSNDTIYIATHGTISECKVDMLRPYFKNIEIVAVECKYVCEDQATGETVIVDEETMNTEKHTYKQDKDDGTTKDVETARYFPIIDEETSMPMIMKIIPDDTVLVDNHAALFSKYATAGTYIEKCFITDVQ